MQKKHSYFCTALSVQFLHWNCIFYTAEENCVLQCKNCNALAIFCCILEQSNSYTAL